MTLHARFGELVRSHRQKLGLGLREFCVESGIDPAYLSRIERGLMQPPQDPERLAELARQLGLRPDSSPWTELMDAAALCSGKLPEDIRDDERMLMKLPVLFRTIRGQRLTEAKLRELIEFLRDK